MHLNNIFILYYLYLSMLSIVFVPIKGDLTWLFLNNVHASYISFMKYNFGKNHVTVEWNLIEAGMMKKSEPNGIKCMHWERCHYMQ